MSDETAKRPRKQRAKSDVRRVPINLYVNRNPAYRHANEFLRQVSPYLLQRRLQELMVLGFEEGKQVTDRWVEEVIQNSPPERWTGPIPLALLRKNDPPSPITEYLTDDRDLNKERALYSLRLHLEDPAQRAIWDYYQSIDNRLRAALRTDRVINRGHQVFVRSALLAGIEVYEGALAGGY